MDGLNLSWKLPERIRAQVGCHPLAAFIFFAYAVSWIAWLRVDRIEGAASNAFSTIGGGGPALAGPVVSALARPERSGVPASRRGKLLSIVGLLIMALLAVRRL